RRGARAGWTRWSRCAANDPMASHPSLQYRYPAGSTCVSVVAGGEAGAATRAEVWGAMSSSQPPDPPLAQVRFLTVAEVAALMRVSKMTVYRLVHSGELTAGRVGRSYRAPADA